MNDHVASAAFEGGLPETGSSLLEICNHHIVDVKSRTELSCDAQSLYILIDGWACKYRLLSSGRRQVIGLHLSGNLCNLEKMFFPILNLNIQAITRCKFAEIPFDCLKVAMEKQPRMRDLFWSLAILENVTLAELVTTVGSRTARERVAWMLCDLVDRLTIRGKASENSFRLELSQVDVAETLGLSVVHVNRMLQGLKAEGLIQTRSSHYTILDLARLKEVAGYDIDILMQPIAKDSLLLGKVL